MAKKENIQALDFEMLKNLNQGVNTQTQNTDFAKITEILTRKGKSTRLSRLSKSLRKVLLKLKTVDVLYMSDLKWGFNEISEYLMDIEVSGDGKENLLGNLTKLTETKFRIEESEKRLEK